MRIEKVNGALFKDGVQIGNTVRQSISVAKEGEIQGTVGVFLVEAIETHEFGLLVRYMRDWHLIPWHLVSSCRIETNDRVKEPPAGAEVVDTSAYRVDPVKRK